MGIEPTTSGLDLPSLCRGFDSHRGQKIFSLPRVVPCFPLLGLTPSGLFIGLSSTIRYASELIFCSTISVPSATRHNIHMYPYFFFAAIHHLKSFPTFSVRPCSSVGRVTVDLIRRSWVLCLVWFPVSLLKCVSETTQMSISFANRSASSAKLALIPFRVLVKLQIFRNMHLGTAYLPDEFNKLVRLLSCRRSNIIFVQ